MGSCLGVKLLLPPPPTPPLWRHGLLGGRGSSTCFLVALLRTGYLLWVLLLEICTYRCKEMEWNCSALPLCLVFWNFIIINPGVVVVQWLSHVWLFATQWTAARQAPQSFTVSLSLLKLIFIEWVMTSSHLILCRPLLLLPSIFPSSRVFSND